MDKKKDILLRRLLKGWANRQAPPDNGRARLLWAASQASRNKIDLDTLLFRPQLRPHPAFSPRDWTQTLFAWVDENSLQYRFQVHLI